MLKVQFKRKGSSVYMQVLEQTNIDRGCGRVFSDGGCYIESEYSPLLMPNAIGVRGEEKEFDYNVKQYTFDTPYEADQYIDSTTDLIQKYNQSCFKKECTSYTETVDQVLIVGDPDLLLIKIIRDDADVIIKILEQNDSEIKRGQGLLYKTKNMELKTSAVVASDWGAFWIKGNGTLCTDVVTCISFASETKAKQYVENVVELIEGFITDHKRMKDTTSLDREVVAK